MEGISDQNAQTFLPPWLSFLTTSQPRLDRARPHQTVPFITGTDRSLAFSVQRDPPQRGACAKWRIDSCVRFWALHDGHAMEWAGTDGLSLHCGLKNGGERGGYHVRGGLSLKGESHLLEAGLWGPGGLSRETPPRWPPHFCPYLFLCMMGLEVPLNLEVSYTCIPQGRALLPGSLPFSCSTPGLGDTAHFTDSRHWAFLVCA